MAIAYQSNIPIVCISGIGGWSERLAGTFIDDRKRLQCVDAKTAEEAVEAVLNIFNNATK